MNYHKARDFIIKKMTTELKTELTYHNVEHTMDVMQAAENFARQENVNGKELTILKTAAVFHDSGMLKTYIGHEEASIEIANKYLPDFGYEQEDIETISKMILTTKLPQSASTFLEKIICDADLDYLGREDFFMIAHKLKYEWNVLDIRKTSLREWYELQIMFLENHIFFTNSAKELRDEKKSDNLKQVQELVCFMK